MTHPPHRLDVQVTERPEGVDIRPARPEDAEAAVELIYSSGPRELDYLLGSAKTSTIDVLRDAFVRGAGLFGHRVHRVIVADGRVVGIGAFYSGRDVTRLDTELSLTLWRAFGPRGVLPALRRGLQLSTLMPSPDRATSFVAQLGVAPDVRGQGFGTMLLRHQIRRARREGFERCALDVATTNPRAQALYERLGFRVVAERHWPEGRAFVPHQRRLVLGLRDP